MHWLFADKKDARNPRSRAQQGRQVSCPGGQVLDPIYKTNKYKVADQCLFTLNTFRHDHGHQWASWVGGFSMCWYQCAVHVLPHSL